MTGPSTFVATRLPVPQPSPGPPRPPVPPIAGYTGNQTWIIHQNPPSYSDQKDLQCSNQTFEGCAQEARHACDRTPGCLSFSVISKQFDQKVWAMLGPLSLDLG